MSQKRPAQSLASPNSFPAEFPLTYRDWFECRSPIGRKIRPRRIRRRDAQKNERGIRVVGIVRNDPLHRCRKAEHRPHRGKQPVEEIKRRGGTVTLEPTVVELPGVKFVRAAIADPDGNEFVISSR